MLNYFVSGPFIGSDTAQYRSHARLVHCCGYFPMVVQQPVVEEQPFYGRVGTGTIPLVPGSYNYY